MRTQEHWYPARVHELSKAECLDLLRARTVGRVAYCDEDGPSVLPVNYAMDGEDIVILTAQTSSIALHLRHARAAFQIDDIDDYDEIGWSVLVRGIGEYVDSVDELPDEARPAPWAEGLRSRFIRITPRAVTGRRLSPR